MKNAAFGPSGAWRVVADTRGGSAIEFAVIAAVLFALTLGAIEFANAASQWVEAEKATQLGVRAAVVSDSVAAGLRAASCETVDAPPGTPCAAAGAQAGTTFLVTCFATTAAAGGAGQCNGRPGAWSTAGCNGNGFCPATFDTIVGRMQSVLPRIGRLNVEVEYRDDFGQARLGYAGRPSGPIPLVTVRLRNMQYQVATLGAVFALLGGSLAAPTLTMPGFAATLTGEDLRSLGS